MKKLVSVGAVALAALLAVSGCTPPKNDAGSAGASNTAGKTGGTLNVMWNQAFYSYNNGTTSTNATTNTNIIYLTNDAPTYYDKSLSLKKNESFAKYEKTSDNPLTVKMTISDKAKWSDGTPVTAADFMLTLGAASGSYNTVKDEQAKEKRNKDTDQLGEITEGVYFDSSSAAWSLIKDFPEISADGKTFTYKFSKPYADWEYTLVSPGVPAHILAKRALGVSDAKEGGKAVIEAFKSKDTAKLTKMANAWNRDWNFDEMPSDADLLVCNGPYKITDFKKKQYLTVSRNDKYEGEHKPKLDSITVRYNEEPQAAVQALRNGEVQIISPQSTADILSSIKDMKNVKFENSEEGTYEHVDLVMGNKGPFDPASYGGDAEKARKVRQAFLTTIPRDDIVDKIIKPLSEKAEVRNSFNVVPGAPNYADTVAGNGMKDLYGKVDVEKAKSLLAEAGATAPQVRIMYAEGNQRRQQEFQLMKEQAEKAGFKVIGQPNAKWGSKLGDGTYDVAIFGWQSTSVAVSEADANFRGKDPADAESKAGNNNFSNYFNPEVNKLYDELQTSLDSKRQKEINLEVEKHLVKDAFGVTLYQFPGLVAWDEKVQNVSAITLSPTMFWNFWEWSL